MYSTCMGCGGGTKEHSAAAKLTRRHQVMWYHIHGTRSTIPVHVEVRRQAMKGRQVRPGNSTGKTVRGKRWHTRMHGRREDVRRADTKHGSHRRSNVVLATHSREARRGNTRQSKWRRGRGERGKN